MFYADVDVLFDSFAVTVAAEPAVDEHLPASSYGAKPLVKLIGGAPPHRLL
jgi:hypothetical protein